MFADGQDAKNPGDVNPMLPTIATYVNTLGKYGVPAEHRHIVIMFHQRTPDIDIVMTNEAYKERYNRDNPNIAIIHALKQAGVDIRVCGQGLIGAEDRCEAGQPRRPDRSVGDDDAGQPAAEGIRARRLIFRSDRQHVCLRTEMQAIARSSMLALIAIALAGGSMHLLRRSGDQLLRRSVSPPTA